MHGPMNVKTLTFVLNNKLYLSKCNIYVSISTALKKTNIFVVADSQILLHFSVSVIYSVAL